VRALVTDVHTRSGVAGLRALGHAGVEVVAFAPSRAAAGLWSRHRAGRSLGPDPVADPVGFCAALAGWAQTHGPVVVYPGQEASIDEVLGTAQRCSGIVLPYSGAAPVRALRDKCTLPALAEEAGVAVPRTFAEATKAELDGSLGMPCVVKRTRLGVQARARIVRSHIELHRVLEGVPEDESLLVQEQVRGPLIGLALVVGRDGRPVARLQQVALRTWPRDAGGSSLAVSVAPDERLTLGAVRLLRIAGYWGLAQLQFIDTARGPALIDVNTRFYGSMPLALASGVNLAAAWHAVATGAESPDPAGSYRSGVAYRSLRHDLSAAAHGAPRALLERSPNPTAGALWARDDPIPSALLAAQAVSSAARRLASGVGRRAG
jgi:predicted ATP-grasp superfamily ATP-dependent carboligase